MQATNSQGVDECVRLLDMDSYHLYTPHIYVELTFASSTSRKALLEDLSLFPFCLRVLVGVGERERRGEVSRDVTEVLGCATTDKDSSCTGLGTIVSIGMNSDPSTSSISMCTATVFFGGSGYSSGCVGGWVCGWVSVCMCECGREGGGVVCMSHYFKGQPITL